MSRDLAGLDTAGDALETVKVGEVPNGYSASLVFPSRIQRSGYLYTPLTSQQEYLLGQ